MANDCSYTMRAVAQDKNALDRLKTIMNYKDGEFFIYRVRDVDECNDGEENGLHFVDLYGDVAWSDDVWVHDEEKKSELITIGYEKDENGMENWDKPIKGTAHYTNLLTICKELGIAIEIWSEEYGMCFQHHTFIAKDGTYSFEREDAFYVGESRDEEYLDELRSRGFDVDDCSVDCYYVGGFEDYCTLKSPSEIWAKAELEGDL